MSYRIGVDVGGTFTDVVALADDGSGMHIAKNITTSDDQSEGVVCGITELLAREGISRNMIGYLAHGTTVCINAVLERKGAKTGLVTTRGMRDLLELRRQVRDELYNLQADKADPLIPRRHRLEINERVLFDGSVREPLSLDEAARAIDELVRDGVSALAVFFLHSYANPSHEQAVRDLAQRRHPGLYVTASSDVLSEFREFERLSTTVLNAYVGPVMDNYLMRLEHRIRALDLPVTPYVSQSNGGVATVAHTRRRPVFTMASGPTSGVAGAIQVAQQAGHGRIITFDMGGTSTDVCLVDRGVPMTATQKSYGGFPAKGAILDVHSVGAGGGSVAWIDRGGFLRVGPESAGAHPGPACYRRGGSRPTVTDANVVLGRLDPEYFLGGQMRLDQAHAAGVIARIAEELGVSLVDTARGILTIVNAHMASAVRLISVERGYDPRQFTLVAYGGAGPMHAATVARHLRIPSVLVPPNPGVLCALGLVVADVKAEFSRTWIRRTDELDPADLAKAFSQLEQQALDWAKHSDLTPASIEYHRSVDMRYLRQNYELTLPLGRRTSLPGLVQKFHRLHSQTFGHSSLSEPTEMITLRVALRQPVILPEALRPSVGSDRLGDAIRTRRRAYFHDAGGFVDCPIYERAKLPFDAKIAGPAIVEQLDCTIIVGVGQDASTDQFGNLLIATGPPQDSI